MCEAGAGDVIGIFVYFDFVHPWAVCNEQKTDRVLKEPLTEW